MTSTVLTLAFTLWVLFQVWRGFRDGVWKALLSLLGFVAAYAVTLVLGADVNAAVAQWGFNHDYRIYVVYPVLFLSVSALVRYIPLLVFSALSARSYPAKLGGAAVGLVSGVVSGLVAIWFINVAQAAIGVTRENERPALTSTPPAMIEQTASSFVARSAQIGLKLSGASDTEAAVSANMIRRPNVSLKAVQSLLQSHEMRSFLQDPSIQSMMARNDSGSVQASEAFQALLRLPDTQVLMALLHDGERDPAAAQTFVAEQLTFVWRRLNYLKHDPRVGEVLNDEQVQASLRDQNVAALLANAKFHRLVGIVLDREQAMSSVDFASYLGEGGETSAAVTDDAVAPRSSSEIYTWFDADGAVRYADWERIPPRYRDAAKKLHP